MTMASLMWTGLGIDLNFLFQIVSRLSANCVPKRFLFIRVQFWLRGELEWWRDQGGLVVAG